MQYYIEHEVWARIEAELLEHEVMDRVDQRLKLEGGAGAEQSGAPLIEAEALLKKHKVGVVPEPVVESQGKENKSQDD